MKISPRALATLTDARVTQEILNLNSTEPGLQKAREILERINTRDFYK